VAGLPDKLTEPLHRKLEPSQGKAEQERRRQHQGEEASKKEKDRVKQRVNMERKKRQTALQQLQQQVDKVGRGGTGPPSLQAGTHSADYLLAAAVPPLCSGYPSLKGAIAVRPYLQVGKGGAACAGHPTCMQAASLLLSTGCCRLSGGGCLPLLRVPEADCCEHQPAGPGLPAAPHGGSCR